MSTGHGCDNDDIDDDPSREASGRSVTGVTDRSTFDRRQALSALGTLSLATTAGCLGSLDLGGGREEISPVEPGDDPDATPGEFYYLLEAHEIDVDRLQLDPEYRIEDEVAKAMFLFYNSNAEDFEASDSEIWTIYEAFKELVDHGTDVEYLITDVQGGFDEQVDGWSVNAVWAEQHLNEDGITDDDIWHSIVTHGKVYEGEHRYEDGSGGIEIGGDGDQAGEDGEIDEG
ncbi:hypothetical protein [Natronobacterium gregoryi]|uniref:DUF8159 domain-containing protein n=2 Tax=Natronobacterium gregoryi TaxID=44930 RepID=L0AGW0_NATGS|nr:hypothetical protein [Natronobacterium gregoryi]AFZ73113.1 hypothetical protein Natgr_1930 [Natronobacterium gregoryi SP2]ELY70788.1 hypothetical protein C490_05842 [Natronobacterium gregoryi SP2]PLK20368.1 hypothetical protein CYV19_09565 [Natronobacterium gregoryi SP2]SFI60913.1 hypothetical protein SAMN05443661_102152 [Natronobacterium gregoryi]